MLHRWGEVNGEGTKTTRSLLNERRAPRGSTFLHDFKIRATGDFQRAQRAGVAQERRSVRPDVGIEAHTVLGGLLRHEWPITARGRHSRAEASKKQPLTSRGPSCGLS